MLTFTGAGSTSIESRGYDKNGYQSIGTNRTYVYTEGDTISFTMILLMNIIPGNK